MKPRYDFSKARRGPLVPKDSGKTQITIGLENHSLEYLEEMVDRSGGGSLDNVINTMLRDLVALCERVSVEERASFFKRAAHGNLTGAFQMLSEVAGENLSISNHVIARTRPTKSRPKKAVGISTK